MIFSLGHSEVMKQKTIKIKEKQNTSSMKNKQASFPATPANNYYFYLKKPAVSTIRSEHLVSLQLWATTWSESLDFQSKTSSKLSLELKSPIIDKVEVHGQETCLVKWQSSPNTLQCPTAPRQLRALAHNLVIAGTLGPLLEGAPSKDPWGDRSFPPSLDRPKRKSCSGSPHSRTTATARAREGRETPGQEESKGWWNQGFQQLPHFLQVSLQPARQRL